MFVQECVSVLLSVHCNRMLKVLTSASKIAMTTSTSCSGDTKNVKVAITANVTSVA